jgi:hypothetical protein
VRKWLLVLDQVGHAAFTAALAATPGAPQGWGPHRLDLDYIPRTTPVGHATISTGLVPADHLIQGRAWFSYPSSTLPGSILHRVEALPNTFPVAGTVFHQILNHSLARQLRAAAGEDAIIVAAAAKNFIPFLFGAWDTDVSVYPRTIAPEAYPSGFGIDVVFDAFTPRAHAVIPSIASQLSALAIGLVGAAWTVRWLPVQLATLGPGHARHAMRWTVPTAWGTSLARVRSKWRQFLDPQIIAVDEFYSDVIEALLGAMSHGRVVPEIALQSCVATDSFGHWHGPSSARYATGLAAGIARAQRLSLHSAVLVTSDHGGRDTPAWWPCAAGVNGGTGTVTTPHSTLSLLPGTPVLEGDHLVGYRGWRATTPVVAGKSGFVHVSPTLLLRSFHPAQMPDWIVLPGQDAMIVDVARGSAGGGGSHGACEHHAVLSPIDGAVSLWALPQRAPPTIIPSSLDGVAAAFLALS